MAEYGAIIGANAGSAFSSFGDWALTKDALVTYAVGALALFLLYKLLKR